MQAMPEPDKMQACSTCQHAHPKGDLPYSAQRLTAPPVLHLSVGLPVIAPHKDTLYLSSCC